MECYQCGSKESLRPVITGREDTSTGYVADLCICQFCHDLDNPPWDLGDDEIGGYEYDSN